MEVVSQSGTLQIEHTTGGYTCSNCGVWVSWGVYHTCPQPSTSVFFPITYTTIDSQRLAELMEAERKLKEIRKILNE